MSEDLKKNGSFKIYSDDFINRLFSRCELHLLFTFRDAPPEIFICSDYNDCKNNMANNLKLLNEFNYLRPNSLGSLIQTLDGNSIRQSMLDRISDLMRSNLEFTDLLNIYLRRYDIYRLPIEALLRWFTLIYEVKIMFGCRIHHLFELLIDIIIQ
ncbi:hypothetical protein RF11_05054 [Thelohanellus kitauei]|uniref:Uncharacterized protein n=1 Tax=Thelohanellus kitauei TaxID=669202 RepID=A0A0C2NEF1_THEKT|nr:hypothetical protein RF11_05054 [Thelohanellus kitauei]